MQIQPEEVQPGDVVEITETTGATYKTKVIQIHPNPYLEGDQCIEGELISIRFGFRSQEYDPSQIGDHPFSRIQRVVKVE